MLDCKREIVVITGITERKQVRDTTSLCVKDSCVANSEAGEDDFLFMGALVKGSQRNWHFFHLGKYSKSRLL